MPSPSTAGKDTQQAPNASAVHPRPQLARDAWLSLDGTWQLHRPHGRGSEASPPPGQEIAGGPDHGAASRMHHGPWSETIRVPFAPEAPLSGIGDQGFQPFLWYRREFHVPEEWRGQRIHLMFGAVDYRATVWVDGSLAVRHEGGYTPFGADITDLLRPGNNEPHAAGPDASPDERVHEVVVLAEDDPFDMTKPRGKQDWLAEPHAIWYPRTTGIWQSVWLEAVPPTRIEGLRIVPDLARFALHTTVEIGGAVGGLVVDVRAALDGRDLVHDSWSVSPSGSEGMAGGGAERSATRTIHLPDPGIDDARRAFLWSPEHPNLIDIELVLRLGDRVLDRVRSYTALREVGLRGGRFELNGRPYFLRLALDQGYWPDGHLTPPTPDALRADVELAKALGFNGVRKHQKIEDPRWLYWADRLGLLVWSEMPSAYSFSPRAVERLARQCMELIARDRNHPCIVAWVVFNESWGVPDLPASGAQRDAVRALTGLAGGLDGSRPVVGNDGWEYVAGDMLTVHDYEADPDVLRVRYATPEALAELSQRSLPSGRTVCVEQPRDRDLPVVLSEFGGVRLAGAGDGWGYAEAASAEAFLERYRNLVGAVTSGGLAGFCYTQLTDTFQEQNGLVTMDRTPKAPLEALAAATKGRGE